MDLPLWKALAWPQGSPLVCPLFFCARRRPEGHHAPLQQFAQQWLREVPRIVMADTREQGGLCAVNGVEVLRRAVGSGKNQAHNHPNDTHCRAFLNTSALSDGAHTGAHHLGTALVRPQHASHNVVAAARAGKKLFAGARHRLPRSCTCRPLERPPATPGPVSSRGGARPLIRTSPFCSGSWSLADRQARPVARGGLRSHCARACRVRGSDAARGSLPSLEWWSVFPLSESLPT